MPDDCYWIMVTFKDDTTLVKRESYKINEIYSIYGKYSAKTWRNRNVKKIVVGRGETHETVMFG